MEEAQKRERTVGRKMILLNITLIMSLYYGPNDRLSIPYKLLGVRQICG
jgi:hypothetical protein